MRHLLLFGLLISCTAHNHRPNGNGNGDGGLNFGEGDDVEEFDLSMSSSMDDLAMSVTPPDFYGLGPGQGVYNDLAINFDAAGCATGQTAGICPNPIASNVGCEPAMSDPEICGNGMDDNCDGRIDELCPCTPGEVQRCFLGPPGKLNVGACTAGTQTCEGIEFGNWGDCVGGIGPGPEACDGVDNDCNGCVDDGLCCGAGLICPIAGDPRIADIAPYHDKALSGGDFFTGTAVSWKWTVVGGPCDVLFSSASFTPKLTPRPQSFTLMNGNSQNATVHFTLSGDYTVTLKVVDDKGLTWSCTWIQHVIGPGVRFELCWDHQGTTTQKGADLDLHVHKPGSMVDWYDLADDCHWDNCDAPGYTVNWGYGNNANADNCSGSKWGSTWTSRGYCANPRLDQDNVSEVGVAENTNLDDPHDGDTFRAMVHYYGQGGGTSTQDVSEHPMVNIYCGGKLKATYGKLGASQIAGFNHGSGKKKGMIWRVADVAAIVDSMGNTTDCTVTQLHEPGMTTGYWVNTDKSNTDFTY